MSVKTVADLTKDVIAQTIENIIVHHRENIEIVIRNFGEEAVLEGIRKGGVGHE
jgi:hypothetical protein